MQILVEEETLEKAQKALKSWPKARFVYTVDHQPILDGDDLLLEDEEAIKEIILDQRLRNPDNTWYVDDYGFYVYAASYLSFTGTDEDESRIGTGLFTP